MADKELISKKLEAIALYLTEIEPILELPFKEFYKNYRDIRTAERDFQLIVDTVVDINTHLILEHNGSVPESNFESFLVMEEIGILSPRFAKELAPGAGLRNKLVHEYERVDPFILYKSLQKFVPLYRKYGKEIAKLLK